MILSQGRTSRRRAIRWTRYLFVVLATMAVLAWVARSQTIASPNPADVVQRDIAVADETVLTRQLHYAAGEMWHRRDRSERCKTIGGNWLKCRIKYHREKVAVRKFYAACVLASQGGAGDKQAYMNFKCPGSKPKPELEIATKEVDP